MGSWGSRPPALGRVQGRSCCPPPPQLPPLPQPGGAWLPVLPGGAPSCCFGCDEGCSGGGPAPPARAGGDEVSFGGAGGPHQPGGRLFSFPSICSIARLRGWAPPFPAPPLLGPACTLPVRAGGGGGTRVCLGATGPAAAARVSGGFVLGCFFIIFIFRREKKWRLPSAAETNGRVAGLFPTRLLVGWIFFNLKEEKRKEKKE